MKELAFSLLPADREITAYVEQEIGMPLLAQFERNNLLFYFSTV